MNIAGFGLVFYAYGDPTVLGGAKGWNLNMWVINNMFFEGTMRAMFSMLFGVGMVLGVIGGIAMAIVGAQLTRTDERIRELRDSAQPQGSAQRFSVPPSLVLAVF